MPARLARRARLIHFVVAAELSLALGQMERHVEQWQVAEEALSVFKEHGLLETAGYEATAHTAYGSALAARGLPDDARHWLEHGLTLRPPTRFQLLDAMVPLIPVVRRIGDRDEAAALLMKAHSVLADCKDPGGFIRRLDAVQRQFDRPIRRSNGHSGDLTPAELRVLRLLDAGLSERAIGDELFVTFNTVHGHVKSIYGKLAVNSRDQALEAARSLRLL
jgi:LuxR family maltose regulon positive regulatory protein